MEPPAPASISAEAANLLRRQQKLRAMEVFNFEGVDFVRLRLLRGGRARYLHAAEDGRSVRLDHRRDSHNAVWAVAPYFYGDMAIHCVLLRGAYGRYLGAPDATALGCLGLPSSSSSRCRVARQRDYDRVEVPAILWRAVATGCQGAFLLQNATERYLRANSRCPLPCCSGLHVSARAGLCATQWAVERVPRARAGRPDLPRPTDSLFARLCPPLSRLCMSEREIRWVRADGNGVCSRDEWPSERFTGRLTIHLKRQLASLLPMQATGRPDYTLCVRAGRHAQLSPLVVNLPRSREPLDIVLVGRNTEADTEFVYPDVHAVAGAAAAVEEPVH